MTAAQRWGEFRKHLPIHADKRQKHACPVCLMEMLSKIGLKTSLETSQKVSEHKSSFCPKAFHIVWELKHIWEFTQIVPCFFEVHT